MEIRPIHQNYYYRSSFYSVSTTFCPSHILPRGVAQWLRLSKSIVFLWELVEPDNAMGLTLFMMWLFDALLCVLFVTVIVGRSKLAWDFAVTVYIINLIVVWTYTGKFPSSILWWCLQVLSAVLLVTLSTYSTRWNELRTTFFDGMVDTTPNDIEMQNIS